MDIIPEISIITPSKRWDNLPKLYESMESCIEFIQWIVIFDSEITHTVPDRFKNTIYGNLQTFDGIKPAVGYSGNPQRNFAFGFSTGKYIYYLDDDNILHPNFFSEVRNELDGDNIVLVNQIDKGNNKRLVAASSSMYAGAIDTAQMIIPRKYLTDMSWDNFEYCADGFLAKNLHDLYKNNIKIIDKNLCYYNFLG